MASRNATILLSIVGRTPAHAAAQLQIIGLQPEGFLFLAQFPLRLRILEQFAHCFGLLDNALDGLDI